MNLLDPGIAGGFGLLTAFTNIGVEEANKARMEKTNAQTDTDVANWKNDLKNNQVANSMRSAFDLQTLQAAQNMTRGDYGDISNLQSSYDQRNAGGGGGGGSLLV